MSSPIYLEVDKNNGAILSYFLDLPTTPSATVNYVPATKAELAYLNGLENSILPPGMVVTLDDLEAHRARVKAAKQAETLARQKPKESDKTASATIPRASNADAKASLVNALRKHRSSNRA